MNSRRAEIILASVLYGIAGYMVAARGAYYRIYWYPAWIALALLFSTWLIFRIFGTLKSSPLPLPLLIPPIVFAVLALSSGLDSIKPEASRFELLRLAGLLMIYFLGAQLFQEAGLRKGWLWFLAALGFGEALFGLIQYSHGDYLFRLPGLPYRPPFWAVSGTFQDYNNFAGLMELSIFPALALLGLPRRRTDGRLANALAQWLVLSLPVAVMIAALALSISRAGWVSAAAGLFVFAGLTMPWRRMTTATWVLLVIVLFAGALATVSLLDRSLLKSRAQTVADAVTGKDLKPIASRVMIWQISRRMIEDRPWLGVGPGAYVSAFPSYRSEGAQFTATLAHNDFLHLAAEDGLPAAAAWAAWIAAAWVMGLKAFLRTRDPLRAAGLAAIAAVMCHGIVATHFQIPGLAALLVLMMAAVVSRPGEGAKP